MFNIEKKRVFEKTKACLLEINRLGIYDFL